jgi:hypothetical protein
LGYVRFTPKSGHRIARYALGTDNNRESCSGSQAEKVQFAMGEGRPTATAAISDNQLNFCSAT